MENQLLFVPKSSRTGTAFDGYKAISIAEGFAECNDPEIEIEAWAAIGQLGIYKNVQGFYGRSLESLVRDEFLFEDFTINWDMVDQVIAFN